MAGESKLPSDWEIVNLGDLGRIVTGKTPSTKVAAHFGGDIPFITPSDMDGRRVIADTGRYLTEHGAASVSSAQIPEGAVMVSCIGSDMGKAAIAGRDAVTNQQINSTIVQKSFSNLYVYYNLSARKAEFQHLASSGSAQPILNKGHFSQLDILLPPLLEQQAIACILGTLDDKIELNRRMNQTLEGMARAIFKSWFVDFDPVRAKVQRKDAEAQRRKEKQGQDSFASWRLGGSALDPTIADLFPDAFEASELGEIPKGWEVTGLYAVATLKKESVKPMRAPAKLWEHYSIPAFDAGRIPVVETGTNIKSSKYRVPIASVLVSKLNPRFPRVWLPDVQDEEAAICSTEFMPFVPLHNAWRPFLYELIKSDAVQQGIQERVTGSTGSRQRARPKDVAEMHVIVPSTELIETFGRTVGPLHEKMLTRICESRTIAALRDTLLPKLISGELRVPDAEKFCMEVGL